MQGQVSEIITNNHIKNTDILYSVLHENAAIYIYLHIIYANQHMYIVRGMVI